MRRKLLICLGVLTLLLSGCSLRTFEQLYYPPKRSQFYMNLQSVIDQAMVGREYSAPTAGDNQQTVQMADLNGDGQEEYLLFAKDASDRPLKILVFAGDGEEYVLVDTVESIGASFDRVDYVQMDGMPGMEMVVSYKVSDQVMRSLSVYTLIQGKAQALLSVNCNRFVCRDFNGDGRSSLLIFRSGEGTEEGLAEMYGLMGHDVEHSAAVPMSVPVEQIRRITVGKLYGGRPAVYVDSGSEAGPLVTDVFTSTDGQFVNLQFLENVDTHRSDGVFAEDLDGDGVVELPQRLSAVQANMNGGPEPGLLRWYALSEDGTARDKFYTYHHFDGGWYLLLDHQLAPDITVDHQGSGYDFILNGSQPQRLFTLYVLTGQKREEQAVANNRFVIYRTEATVYAVDLDVNAAAYGISQDSMVASFKLIRQKWITGEN